MPNEPVVAVEPNQGLKAFIIGKLWLNSQNGSNFGSIRISNTLPTDITLKPGTTIFLYPNPNPKREGRMDPDFNVNVLLPVELAEKLIAAERENMQKFSQEQETAAVN